MVQYRKMTLADVESVYAIELATFPTPWTLDSFYYELNENQFSHYLVAEEDGKLIGFCGMWLVIDAAQITNVAVVETARGRGIGEALMREAIRVAREANMDVMSLEVRSVQGYPVRGQPVDRRGRNRLRTGAYQRKKEDREVTYLTLLSHL